MGHLTALKDLRQKGFVIFGGSGEALEEGESPRPRRYPRRHVTGAPTRVRYAVCRTGSMGAPSPNTWPSASRRGALNIPEARGPGV